MSFIEAVRVCLSEKYFTISGRASRSEYWWFTLAGGLFAFIWGLSIAFAILLVDQISGTLYAMLMLFFVMAMLALIVPSITVSIRRLHDTGRSGWWYFVTFLPYVGSIILLVFTLLPSEEGENEYGPNPNAVEENETFIEE